MDRVSGPFEALAQRSRACEDDSDDASESDDDSDDASESDDDSDDA